tara:strand:- start:81 stop:704 length:624 start_codon:yes stop_codon:yes gene_type:complete
MFIDSSIKNNIQDMGINIFLKNHVSSTNDYIQYKYIKDQTPIIIFTNNQRNPRGQRGSLWIDYQNYSLSFSLCTKLEGPIKNYENLSQIVGLSIIRSCENLDINNLKLKTPNDIMLKGKKVCGILIENILDNQDYFYSTIGIGLNLSIPDRLLNVIEGNPGNINIKSTQTGILLRDIVKNILKDMTLLKNKGFNSFVEMINNYKFIQ